MKLFRGVSFVVILGLVLCLAAVSLIIVRSWIESAVARGNGSSTIGGETLVTDPTHGQQVDQKGKPTGPPEEPGRIFRPSGGK